MADKKLFYFGCIGGAGHYLWESNSSKLYDPRVIRTDGVNWSLLGHIGGVYTRPGLPEGVYNECIIPPLRVLAWHDYSVDKRGNSNSALIGYGYSSADEMLDDAAKKFPSVMNRQKRPIPSIENYKP